MQHLEYLFQDLGIGDQCKNGGIKNFVKLLSDWSGSQGYCIEIGNGMWTSWTKPLLKQTAIACEKVVKKMSDLTQGYNIVGLSQGNVIGRGIIEFCDGGPPVKNFISLGGPHAGTASIPLCGVKPYGHSSKSTYRVTNRLPINGIPTPVARFELTSLWINSLAPSGYVKMPIDIDGYLKGCKFLPKLNNEIINKRNSTYKQRLASLENLILIMFDRDTILIPKETAWFGFYPDGALHSVLQPQQTKLYTEDWIGLRTLDEAGKVKFFNLSGDHLDITHSDMKTYIVPYLKDHNHIVPYLKDQMKES
ncbi:hypothetical protein TSUD_167090 [Trifolium subterraneum]|nr:hypothetical protein TSUD_167090 [Trifolium subterraneum]